MRKPVRLKPFLPFAFLLLSLGLPITARAAEPPLIPREVLFGNPERTLPRLSPDGTRISWLAPSKAGVLNVWAQTLGAAAGDAQPVTNEPHRPIFRAAMCAT